MKKTSLKLATATLSDIFTANLRADETRARAKKAGKKIVDIRHAAAIKAQASRSARERKAIARRAQANRTAKSRTAAAVKAWETRRAA